MVNKPKQYEREILYQDGSRGTTGKRPIGIAKKGDEVDPSIDKVVGTIEIVDPIFDYRVKDNLYGRIMTLLEATTDPEKLEAVKKVFGEEIHRWSSEVYRSAREIAEGGGSSINTYR